MSKCVKLKVFKFDSNTHRRTGSTKRDQNTNNTSKSLLKDLYTHDKPQPISFKYFELSVTSKRRLALCELKEYNSAATSRKNLYSNKLKLIQDFYTRKRTLKKINHSYNQSFIPEGVKKFNSFDEPKLDAAPKTKSRVIKIPILYSTTQNCICIQTDEQY